MVWIAQMQVPSTDRIGRVSRDLRATTGGAMRMHAVITAPHAKECRKMRGKERVTKSMNASSGDMA